MTEHKERARNQNEAKASREMTGLEQVNALPTAQHLSAASAVIGPEMPAICVVIVLAVEDARAEILPDSQ
jgi:hypothetical protein